MINIDQFRAFGIASEADIESIDTYEDNISQYEKKTYTYIPIPEEDKYYHVRDSELRELNDEQYIHLDTTMMGGFELLLDHPFLLYAPKMEFDAAPESAGRKFQPTAELSEDNDVENRYHIITLADVNKRRAGEMFYHALSEFEIQLAKQVKKHYPNSLIEDADEDEIERWYRAKIDQLEMHITEHMHLSTLLTVGGKHDEIQDAFGYPSRNQFDEDLGGLNNLRNKVMHPSRGLVHDREDLESEMDRVRRIKQALEELDGDLVQPDYPRDTET